MASEDIKQFQILTLAASARNGSLKHETALKLYSEEVSEDPSLIEFVMKRTNSIERNLIAMNGPRPGWILKITDKHFTTYAHYFIYFSVLDWSQ